MAVNTRQYNSVLVTGTGATTRSVVASADNGAMQINQITCRNTSAGSLTVYFYIKTDTTTSGTIYPVDSVSVGAGATEIITKMLNHIVPSGGSIQAYDSSGAANYVTVSCSEFR